MQLNLWTLALLWLYSDQETIKPISENNEQKWAQMADEVQTVKLKELMGPDFYQDVTQNPTGTWNAKLINGDTYTKNAITYEFKGLKYVLSYLFYARYIMEINAQDTFSGLMEADNDNARHVSFAQKKNMSGEMRGIAEDHWKDCQDFVCANSSEFPYAKFKTSGKIDHAIHSA